MAEAVGFEPCKECTEPFVWKVTTDGRLYGKCNGEFPGTGNCTFNVGYQTHAKSREIAARISPMDQLEGQTNAEISGVQPSGQGGGDAGHEPEPEPAGKPEPVRAVEPAEPARGIFGMVLDG